MDRTYGTCWLFYTSYGGTIHYFPFPVVKTNRLQYESYLRYLLVAIYEFMRNDFTCSHFPVTKTYRLLFSLVKTNRLQYGSYLRYLLVAIYYFMRNDFTCSHIPVPEVKGYNMHRTYGTLQAHMCKKKLPISEQS